MHEDWKRFYRRQALALALCAAGLLLLFHFSRLDLQLADPWYDPAHGRWPWRDAWLASVFVHRGLKYVLILASLACIAMAWTRRAAINARAWRFVAASSVLVPLVVSLGKRLSPMHCPWEVDRYGGANPYFDLLAGAPSSLATAGHCFPGAFVSSASWLLAFALWRWPEDRGHGITAGFAALAFSLAVGWVQQVRGAHFLSHTLWSLWLSWAIIVALHAALGLWRRPLAMARSPETAGLFVDDALRIRANN